MTERLYIVGPCAAESEEQTLRIAHSLSAQRSVLCQRSGLCSNIIFRAGVWKPRTSPDTFQGVGDIGLTWLQRVKAETGLPVATEVSTPEQVHKALEAGIDYLWLGARTSANPILVQTLADEIKKCQLSTVNCQLKGIFVKNPVNEDAALWIGNIKRLAVSGERLAVMAVHRGCNHRPCWQMAYQLRRALPDVPLLLDPSHMSGDAAKVAELCQIAAELEYDGLMIEVHDDPQHALSDAKQQITPAQLTELTSQPSMPSQPSPLPLRWLRRMMDEVDDALWETIAQRMEISKQIGDYKKAHHIEVLQPTRFEQILSRRLNWAQTKCLTAETVRQIMNALHAESIRVQH